ncbi:MAG TPA: divergent polysaccharide deacetylase family protein [Elusimicrobiota bacterium]|nr:divergent polysaccharide deacetylase family protein [Elusimicrobiota bacterium]
MRRTERGLIGRLMLVALVAAGAWYFYHALWSRYNLQWLSGQLENAVSRSLAEAGVQDSQILYQVRRERQHGPLVWVETQRRIQLYTPDQEGVIDRLLRRAAERYHCQLKVRHDTQYAAYDIQLWRFHFEHVVLALGRQSTAPAGAPQLAIVIDDVAYDSEPMDHFAALGIPLTFAILPRDKHCKDLAQKANDLRFPVILHLPMEPLDLAHNNPGSAALYLSMSSKTLRDQFEKDVASVPHIVGINNHMGSAFTENLGKMELVMRWVRQKHLFFLDSHTSVHSIVPQAARKAGVPCVVNETFLDNSDTVDAIAEQLEIAAKLAKRYKRTIAIGHYRRKHLVEALERELPIIRARGVQLVYLPVLVPAAHQ